MSESVTLVAGTLVTVNGADFCLCDDVEVSPAVPTVLYPRLMWSKHGEEITVKSAEDEADKRAEGYRLTAEAVPAPPAELPDPEPDPEDGPTFGGPQDASFGADAKAQKAARTAARKVHKP